MTEQERAIALLNDVKARLDFYKAGDGSFDDSSAFSFALTLADAETMEAALRAYASPAPADLREAITCLLIETDAESYEDIADEIISLLPQTQEGDVQWKPEATAPYGVKVIAGWAPARGFGSHAELGKRHTDGSWSNNYGHPFSGKPDVWMEIPTIERLDCAADKEG